MTMLAQEPLVLPTSAFSFLITHESQPILGGDMAYLVSGEVPNSATEAAAYNFSAGAERAVA
jgi:hypothetical protein